MTRDEVEKEYLRLKERGEIKRELLDMKDSRFYVLDGFDGAIKGVTDEDNVVYQYDDLVYCMKIQMMYDDSEMDEEDAENDACDYVCYNTLRAIPYMPNPKPIIFFDLE